MSNITCYDNLSYYMDGKESQNQKLQNFAFLGLNVQRNEVIINIKYEDKTLCFSGNLYAVNGKGYYDDKLIIGDFSISDHYNLAIFKITRTLDEQKYSCNVEILLEDTETGSLIEMNQLANTLKFDSLLDIARETTKQIENESQKEDTSITTISYIMNLLQPSHRCIAQKSKIQTRAQSSNSFKSTDSNSGISIDKNIIKSFLSSLRSGSVTPVTAVQNVLNQTGWKFYKTRDFFYVMHGVSTSSTKQNVCITICSISNQIFENGRLEASFTVVDSCLVTFNKSTKKAEAMYFDTGIRIEKPLVALELVGGTTNFYEARKVSDIVTNFSLMSILTAISSKLGVASAIWNALTPDKSTSETVTFGNDENQKYVYGGLIRATANQINSGYLLFGGNYVGIVGNIYTNKVYSGARIAYRFTGYSYI